MRSYHIHHHDWPAFLRDFSHRHHGHPVTLQIISPELEFHCAKSSRPLLDVCLTAGPHCCPRIDVYLGDSPDSTTLHPFHNPRHLVLRTTAPHTEQALQIEAADGTRLLLHLAHSTTPPPTPDT